MTADSLPELPARSSADFPFSRLTAREHAVLVLLAEGLTNIEAAARLQISKHTVAQHIAAMLRHTGSRTRAHLVARAYACGALGVDEARPQ